MHVAMAPLIPASQLPFPPQRVTVSVADAPCYCGLPSRQPGSRLPSRPLTGALTRHRCDVACQPLSQRWMHWPGSLPARRRKSRAQE